MKRLLISVAVRIHRDFPPMRLRSTNPRMNAMTAQEKKDLEMWQNQINQERLPMRRDCHDCILAMGRDRPRRRQICPASYCLSIDVAGPFEPGVDQLAGNPGYFLILLYSSNSSRSSSYGSNRKAWRKGSRKLLAQGQWRSRRRAYESGEKPRRCSSWESIKGGSC